MSELVAMQLKHVEQMAETMEWSAGELENAKASITGDFSFALVDNDDTLALFGGYKINRGVVQVWSVISEKARFQPFVLTRTAMRLLDMFSKRCGVHRFQISIKAGDPRAEAWAYFLGFSCEGRMLKYGPDKSDYWLYGRV